MALRIALFGQADFGCACLNRVIEDGHKPVGVFAPPEGPRSDALADRAEALRLPLVRRRFYQRKRGGAIPAALESYRRLDADLNVLASFTAFLPPEITHAPPHGSICFHPSLLPRFRGGNALQWQIILGEAETGVSIFVPDEGVDTGPIVVQKGGVRITAEDTATALFFKKLSPLGVEAIAEAVNRIDRGQASTQAQDETAATFQGLVRESDAAIDLARPAQEIDRLVRGCDPQPGAYLRWNAEQLRLYDVRLEPASSGEIGRVCAIDEGGLTVELAGGRLRVGRVRADAGKEPARAFAARRGLEVGAALKSG